MSNDTTSSLPSGATLATAKKAAAAKSAKKPRARSTHPRTADMVDSAIKALKERGGSSLQAIKKYIGATYNVDADKLAPFIKKYLKSGVVAKKLVQTKGKGASGSFKLSMSDGTSKRSAAAAAAAVKAVVVKKPRKGAALAAKPVAAKKIVTPKKKVMKTLAAKPPKPKVSKAKPAKKSVAKKMNKKAASAKK